MKQKNIILVAVAVGCGLVAAFLTSTMSAGNKKDEEKIQVFVASKDLSVGTLLKKEEIDTYVEVKEFTKDTVPPQYIATKEELADKRVTRTLRKGESFNPLDVTKYASMNPPPGKNMVAIGCTLEQGVAGFVKPGVKVDILAAIPLRRNNGASKVVTFMVDMLVLAVDSQAQLQTENPATPTISMVSFAVTPEQAELLHGASARGCNMRLVLRNNTDAPEVKRKYTDAQLLALLDDKPADDDSGDGGGDQGKPKPPPAEAAIKLVVAKVDIPAGTMLTRDVIDKQFEMIEFAKPIPVNGVRDIREFYNQYLLKELTQNQMVPQSFIGPKPTDKVEPRKTAPDSEAPPKENTLVPEKPKVSEAPPVFHDMLQQSPNGVKKFRYQKLPNGEFKLLGEVAFDSRPDKVPAPAKTENTTPDDKSDTEAKPGDKKPGKEGKKDGEKIGEAI